MQLAILAQNGYDADRKVAVDAIVTPDALFLAKHLSGLDRAAPLLKDIRPVVWMDGVEPALTGHLSLGLSGEGAPVTHAGKPGAIGGSEPEDLIGGSGERAIV
jgi:hypothetical protein